MKRSIQEIREDFIRQLEDASKQLDSLNSAREKVIKKIEMLKGAIYATDVIASETQNELGTNLNTENQETDNE